MPDTDSRLPVGFEGLEPLVSEWALDTQTQREIKRLRSTPEEIRGFYNAVMPRIRDILDEVDRFPIGELPEPHARLFALAFSLAEVAPNVELYGGDIQVTHNFDERRFDARHGDHPSPKGLAAR